MIFSFNITLHCIEKIKSNKFEEYTKLDEKIGVEDYIEKFKKLIKRIYLSEYSGYCILKLELKEKQNEIYYSVRFV